MKKRIVSIGFTMALVGPSLGYGDTTFVTSLAFQHKSLSFDQKYSGAASNRAKFTADLPMISASASVAAQGFFASFKIEKNLAEISTTTTETDRSLVLESNLLTHPGGTVDVARQDISFTVGYNLWRSLNVFVGYLDGETELSPNPFCANPFPSNAPELSPDAPAREACSRSNRAFQQFFIGDLPAGQTSEPSYYVDDQAAYKQKYREQGFYLGSSYGFNINDIGTLAISFAYASMDGEYKDNANDPNNGLGGSFRAFNFEGDTTGTSLALTWTSGLGENSAYTIDLRRQAYALEGKDKTGNLSAVFLDTDEEMLGLTAGVQLYF